MTFHWMDENIWTEVWLESLVVIAIFWRITNCRTFCGSAVNTWTKLCLKSFISHVVFYKYVVVWYLVECIWVIEKKSTKVDSSVIWCSSQLLIVECLPYHCYVWTESLFWFYFGFEMLHCVNNRGTLWGERQNSRTGWFWECIAIIVMLVQIQYCTIFRRSHKNFWTRLCSELFTANVISHDAT